MPTAAKLVAAIVFALIAVAAGHVYAGLLPETMRIGLLRPLAGVAGAVGGWQIMGANVGRSYAEAGTTGLRTAVTTVFLALLGFAIYTMIMRSFRMTYHGPMEALLAVFAIFIDYGKLAGDRTFLAVVGVGGLVGGFVAEFAGRRWS